MSLKIEEEDKKILKQMVNSYKKHELCTCNKCNYRINGCCIFNYLREKYNPKIIDGLAGGLCFIRNDFDDEELIKRRFLYVEKIFNLKQGKESIE